MKLQRQLLLDFDGVVLRKHHVHKIVAKKCEQLVAKCMSLNMSDAKYVNKYFYQKYGHTLIGINTEVAEMSLEEFNANIYNDIDLKSICLDIVDNKQLDFNEIRSLQALGATLDFDTKIFSNAPCSYCYDILNTMNLDIEVLQLDDVKHLKPQAASYSQISKRYHDSSFIMVDDNYINLLPTLQLEKWFSIHFQDDVIEKQNASLSTACNYNDIHKYILEQWTI